MTVQAASQGAPPKRRRGFQFTERHLPFALLMPSVVIILLIVGFPMLYSLYISFTSYNLTSPGVFDLVGF